MDDKTILQLLWQRAEQALTALAENYGKGLYHLAMNILNCHRDAEEAVNDTYLSLWNAIPPAKPDPLSGYVYRVGRNTALKRLRENTALKRCSKYDVSLDELALPFRKYPGGRIRRRPAGAMYRPVSGHPEPPKPSYLPAALLVWRQHRDPCQRRIPLPQCAVCAAAETAQTAERLFK